MTTLASRGSTALAQRLAEQGDENAEALAAQAVKDRKKAQKANTAEKKAATSLDGDQLADLVKLVGGLSKNKGIHSVAETTGLAEDRIIEVGNLAKSPIRKTGKADRFLSDLVKANAGKAYADGGIWEPGVYSSSRGLIRFAEPETVAESYIPHAGAKRGRATAVLAETADRFGYGLAPRRLVDAHAGRGIRGITPTSSSRWGCGWAGYPVAVSPPRCRRRSGGVPSRVGRRSLSKPRRGRR
ncbi:hypothetical protein [Streptomyces sp. NPDC003006]